MGLNKYCFCYDLDVGVTLVGFLQLNAMLFFWARFSEFEAVYQWFDIAIAMCYTVRITYFFIMIGMDSDMQSRKDYYAAHQVTTFILFGTSVALIAARW